MSGHSKWSTIKRKKGAADAKRGQMFTRLGRAISIAAREGGSDPEMNFALRLAVDKARASNMPQSNIDRAIQRGAGEDGSGVSLEKAVYGGYGHQGVAIAVDVVTDNKNRTVSELRKIMEEHGGTFAEAESVLWQFHEKGVVMVVCGKVTKAEKYGAADKRDKVDPDEVMMESIEIDGVEDIDCDDTDEDGFDVCEVLVDAKKLAQVKGEIEKLGYIIASAEIVKVPEQTQDVDKDTSKKIESLVEAIEEHDDVENVWTTMKK